MHGKGWEKISPTMVATSSSPLLTVGQHVLRFGGLLHDRTHPVSFPRYRQSFSNEVYRRRYYPTMTPRSVADRSNSFCRDRGCGCDAHIYRRVTASQREAIAPLRKLRPENSPPFQGPRISIISQTRTMRPQQPHLQTPFTGTEFEKRYPYCTNT